MNTPHDLLARAERLDREGFAASARGDHRAAIAAFNAALALRRMVLAPIDADIAASLGNLGVATFAAGDPHGARALYREALAIARARGEAEHLGAAYTFTNLGVVAEFLGEYTEASAMAERALAIRRRLHAPAGDIAVSLNNRGNAAVRLGDLATAIASHQEALALRRATFAAGDPRIAASIDNLGHALHQTGDIKTARALHEQALALRQSALGPHHPDVGRSLLHLGNALRTEDPITAAQHYQAAVTIFEAHGAGEGSALAHGNLAALAFDRGEFAQARQSLERALAVLVPERGAQHPLVVQSIGGIAACAAMAGDLDGAERAVRDALQRAAGPDHAGLRAQLWFMLSIIADRRGRLAEAILFGKLAVNMAQATRARLAALETRLQRAFAQAHGGRFRHLAQLLARSGRFATASRVMAMLKEDELFELVRDAGAVRLGFVALTALEAQWQQLGDVALQALAAGAAGSEAGLDSWLAGLRSALAAPDPDPRAGEAAAAQAIGAALAAQENTALLHLIPGPAALTLILATAAGQTGWTVAIGEALLYRLIHELRTAIEHRTPDATRLGQVLHGHLIAPADGALAAARISTLLLAPAGALRYLPFAALHDGTRYLIERMALRIVTEAAPEQHHREPARAPLVAGFGVTRAIGRFPALAGVADELARIVRGAGDTLGVYPGKLWLDQAFTAAALAEGFARHPIVHVASHFVFEPAGGAGSRLLLGDGATLGIAELASDRFRCGGVELLALSACETAMGGEGEGAEMEGVAALVRRQGAKAVLATLWPVEDAGTPVLMAEFYRTRQDEMGDAHALRTAQLTLLKGESRYRDPYYWAAFVVMGGYA